ncbi:Uma2 family endonuclease [Ancylothrix sp. C2]|uniref:Uma2 family endonuclease n=1 Tax=Ancylothrix sp. D3o TaxID=2953691 RepID=UPI0021BA7088|nr:Uma2 family endonuclease [Ancylothrix sp. D3o]MCT7950276.1 Uma2 family endonuclease [Ancylothrix sp. D3o]
MTLTTQRLYSFEEYLKYDDDTDKRYELVDGRLELINPPTFRHLLIAEFINNTFDAEINRLNLPWLCFQKAGVRTGPRKSRLTDIYILRKDQILDFLDSSAITETSPILTVEVVSPDSIKRDYRYKRSEYAALEVSEYWIVDTLEQKLTVLLLEEGLYEETIFTAPQTIISRTFPELCLTVEKVLAAGNIS